MKTLLGLIVFSSLFAVGCAKKSDSSSRIISRPAGATSSATDAQAQAVGLNINWQSTEVNELGETSVTVTHTFSLNGSSQTVSETISTLAPLCSDRQNLQYDAHVVQSPISNVQAAIGTTACWSGTNLYLGLSFMAWSANQYLTQQFVSLNVTAGQAIQIQKLVSSLSSGIFLPDWIYSQFSSN